MAYFPNGISAAEYEDKYCSRCVHRPENPDDGGCSVWLLHLLNNYDECNNAGSYLHVLIPRSDDGTNEECTMFLERK